MLKRFFICFVAVNLCLGFSACKMGAGDDDMGGGLDIVDQPAPQVEFSKTEFKIVASTKTIDLREWVSPVPTNYKLPNITFAIAGKGFTSNGTYITGNSLMPGSSNPPTENWTIKATVGSNTATAKLEIVDTSPFSDSSDNGVTPATLKGKTYVTPNRVGNATSPWYAIHFFDDGKHLGIGRCSIVPANAIRLARQGSGSTGASTGHKVEYEYDSSRKVFTMKSSVGVVGGEFVINGETLKNSFLVDTVVFNLVK